MVNLGAHFPPSKAEEAIRRMLVPGAVIKIRCKMDDGRTKEKRFVVVAVGEQTVTCVINTELTNFAKSRANIVACNVPLTATSSPFLSHDSYVDCTSLRRYSTAEVVSQLKAQASLLLGMITPELRDAMMFALNLSYTISRAELLECQSLADASLT